MPPDKAMLVGGERTNLTEVNLLPKDPRITGQSLASLDADTEQAAINRCGQWLESTAAHLQSG